MHNEKDYILIEHIENKVLQTFLSSVRRIFSVCCVLSLAFIKVESKAKSELWKEFSTRVSYTC